MKPEDFNALPLEARRYIEKQKTCLSCGRANDLDAHYRNYLNMKNGNLFTLRTGAIAFKRTNGESGVLYPIHPNDTEDQIKVKLRLAMELNVIRPDKFSIISVADIEAILGVTEEVEAEEVEAEEVDPKPVKKLYGAAKAAADRKAAEAEELD